MSQASPGARSPAPVSLSDDPAQELLGLLAEEFTAGGIECSVLAADADIPAPLVVDLDGAVVTVCFVPALENPVVLQYLVALDIDVEASDGVARIVALINSALPITGFELSEAAG